MKIIINKGTNEIGGSCVEVSTKNSTILIDYGSPLKKHSTPVKINKSINAILISHPHQDHYGEISTFDTKTPVYCGALSRELMNASKLFTKGAVLDNNFKTFKPWKSFEVGDFKITPYLVDHSSPDAYAFLIDADGKKLLYSGDFRATGRKAKLFEEMLTNKDLKETDVLLLEGTMLQRSNDSFPDEKSVEEKIYDTIKKHNQITFMISSTQNIDSLVSAYRACIRTGKIFVVDIYTAWILEKLKIASPNVPHISLDNVKVVKSYGHGYIKSIHKNEKYFNGFLSKVFHKDNIIDATTIKINPASYFLKISPWYIEKFMRSLDIPTATLIYSQWLGYLKEEHSDLRTVKMYDNLKNKFDFVYAHTSGHADLEALQRFASALKPKKLIPIHTEHKDKFEKHFINVMLLNDGEVYEI